MINAEIDRMLQEEENTIDERMTALEAENAELKDYITDQHKKFIKLSSHAGTLRAEKENLRDQISELREAAKKEFVLMYNRGYHAGHHDTVEGGYVDIFDVDMPTYHSDVVDEILEDSDLRAMLSGKGD